MSHTTKLNLGDYVLASKYSDCDPNDPWRVGFIVKIIITSRGERYVIGEEDGTWSDMREYRHAKIITKEEGKLWIDNK